MIRSLILSLLLMVLIPGVSVAERLAVTASTANVRSGPGTKHDWVWQVGKYYPISVLKKKGAWYFFRDFEGDEGWIHKSLLGKVPTVITTKKKCNVRSGPGTNHTVAYAVGAGIPFKVVKRKGNWIQIEHADGDTGWIHKSLVW